MGSGLSKKPLKTPVLSADPNIVFTCTVDQSCTKNVGCGIREVLLPEVLDAAFEYGPYLLTFSAPKNLGALEVFVPYAAMRILDAKAKNPEVEYIGTLSSLRISFAQFEHEEKCSKLDQTLQKKELNVEPATGWSFTLSIAKKATPPSF